MGGNKGRSIRDTLRDSKASRKLLARIIANRRKRLGCTQAAFAALLGVTERTVWNWEAGVTRPRARDLDNIFPHKPL